MQLLLAPCLSLLVSWNADVMAGAAAPFLYHGVALKMEAVFCESTNTEERIQGPKTCAVQAVLENLPPGFVKKGEIYFFLI